MFLFYSKLLMGEFTRSNAAARQERNSCHCRHLTVTNLAIGTVPRLIGFVVVDISPRENLNVRLG